MLLPLIVLILVSIVQPSAASTDDILGIRTPAHCNLTAYEVWKEQQYLGPLATDPNFWRYQTQTYFELKKGLALELVVADCKNKFKLLETFKAGRSGPVTIQYAYKAMCSSYCLETDRLSIEALKYTGCSCLELSTQPSSPFFSEAGDWCRHNTARLLCDMLGYCGVWECRIDDFMCPRYEWNKRRIDLKGPGTCDRGAASRSYRVAGRTLTAVILFALSALILL